MFLRSFVIIAALSILAVLTFQYVNDHTAITYDVFCPPHEDRCNITVDGVDIEMWRDQLPKYIPIASASKGCYLEFCFNERLQVIGLNPNYAIWSTPSDAKK